MNDCSEKYTSKAFIVYAHYKQGKNAKTTKDILCIVKEFLLSLFPENCFIVPFSKFHQEAWRYLLLH